MSRRTFRGFLSKQEREYLEFLKLTEGYPYLPNNKRDWNENGKLHYRYLDYQIRWKTRQALRELRLVFEKFGYMELQSFFNDVEVLNNIKFLNETIEFVEAQRETRRLERETG
jgi:hypothetical protein